MSPQAVLPPVDVGVILGSGLAVLPAGLAVESEHDYASLGWPVPGAAGHHGRLVVGTLAGRRAAVCHGRSHLYEGHDDTVLQRATRALAAAGARWMMVGNVSGALRPHVDVGDVVVVRTCLDLQRSPQTYPPPAVPGTSAAHARCAVRAFRGALRAREGTYVAVPGPQYETPAEARWLARHGDVVGMSTAPELRALHALRLPAVTLSLVVNRAAEAADHHAVLHTSARLMDDYGAGLSRLLVEMAGGLDERRSGTWT